MSNVPCTRSEGLLMPMSSVTEAITSVLGKQGEMLFESRDWRFPFHARSPEQRIRVREAFVSLTRLGGYGTSRSFGSFGQELFDVLVSVVALTDFHQTGKMEFHPSFDLTRWNVVTTRFQTLRQFFGTAEHPHRLAADIHLEKKRIALTSLHAINLGDDRMNRTPFLRSAHLEIGAGAGAIAVRIESHLVGGSALVGHDELRKIARYAQAIGFHLFHCPCPAIPCFRLKQSQRQGRRLWIYDLCCY